MYNIYMSLAFKGLMIRLEDDMLRPLPFGHVNFKSNMPSKKIYLSQTTGQDLFSALSTCLLEGGCFLKKKKYSIQLCYQARGTLISMQYKE